VLPVNVKHIDRAISLAYSLDIQILLRQCQLDFRQRYSVVNMKESGFIIVILDMFIRKPRIAFHVDGGCTLRYTPTQRKLHPAPDYGELSVRCLFEFIVNVSE
jgi:hypothetical protein